MVEPYLGEIRIVAFNFAPVHWSDCSGQILQISQNEALYSLIGTTYGGDGKETFALPDFQGRLPMHVGQGPGLSNRTLAQKGGNETVLLKTDHLPPHGHPIECYSQEGNLPNPNGAVMAVQTGGSTNLFNSAPNAQMQPAEGGGSAYEHDNMSPFLVLRFCISMVGVYPSRN